MAISSSGYNYTKEGTSFTTTDDSALVPKPGEALYVGELTPDSAQTGDVWVSSTFIKRWNGTSWADYYGSNALTKAGSVTFTGSSTTVTFTSALNNIPSVVVTPVTGYAATTFVVSAASTTQFTIRAVSIVTGLSVSGTYTVNWVANSQGVIGSTQAGVVTGTSDSFGRINVNFSPAYSSTPSVVATWASNLPTGYEPTFAVRDITTTGFKIALFTGEGTTPLTNTTATLYWMATPTA